MSTHLVRLYFIIIICRITSFTNVENSWKLLTNAQEPILPTLQSNLCKYMNEKMGTILIDEMIGDFSTLCYPPKSASNYSASVELSCYQWKFYNSLLNKMEFNILNFKECQTRQFNLHPIKGNNVYVTSYHNTIEAITKLMIYWKVEVAAFFIDNHAGFNIKQLKTYLKKSLTEIAFEVITVDSKLDLVKSIIQPRKKFLNFVIMCNAYNTDIILKVIKENTLFDTSLRLMIVCQAVPKLLQTDFISTESQVTLISTNSLVYYQNDSYLNYTNNHQENNPHLVFNVLLKPEEHYSIELKISPSVYFYDVFYSFHTKQIEYIKFAQWTIENGLFAFENLESNDLNERLKGRRIKLSAVLHLPYINPIKINGSDFVTGYNVEIVYMLMDYFKANHSLKVYPQDWGLIINGSYTGLLGVVYRKETDIPIPGFGISYYRIKALRYLAPLAKLDVSLAYTTPNPVVPPTTYVLPFSANVWFSIIITFACVILALIIAMYFSPGWRKFTSSLQSSHTRLFRLTTMSFFEEVLKNPPDGAAKVIYGTLLLATLATFVFYTSVFTSFLAYRELKMPIRNLRDLIDNRDYTTVTLKGTIYDATLRYAQDGIFYDLWKKMKTTERLSVQPTVSACNWLMFTKKVVVLGDGASTIAATKNNCSISLIRTTVFREYFFLATRNDFPYSRMFYIRLLKLTEGGLINRLSIKYMTGRRPPCDIPAPSLTLGILQVVGLFFLLLCGIVLSLLVLMVEKISIIECRYK